MLDENIRNLQIQAKQIESDYKKGRKISDDVITGACSNYKNVVDGLKERYPEEEFEKEEKSWCYHFNPLLTPLYIKEIVCDLAELAGRAFALMLENMNTPSRPKPQKAPKQTYSSNKYKEPTNSKTNKKNKEKELDSKSKDFGDDGLTVQQRNNKLVGLDKNGGWLDAEKVRAENRQRQEEASREREASSNEYTSSQPEQTMSMGNQ